MKWKIKKHGGTCGCGSRDDVVVWVHHDTGEERTVCVNCNDAAASVRRSGRYTP